MRILMLILALGLLGGCQTFGGKSDEGTIKVGPANNGGSSTYKPGTKAEGTTTVVVTEQAKLPAWAIEAHQKPTRRNDSVEAHLKNEDALDRLVDVLLCHRRLLWKLQNGDAINQKECKK